MATQPTSPYDPRCLIPLLPILGPLLTPAPTQAQQVNLEPLVTRVADAVCDSRIVLLGELPSHGEARTFEAKAGIARRLIERCGFDALLFEAPMYDFVGFQRAVDEGRAVALQLDRAIGRFWWTRELTAWRSWLFGRATNNELTLGGLDNQVSVTSEYARATLPTLVASATPTERSAECEQVVARHLFWRYNDEVPFDEAEQDRLRRCVRDAADAMTAVEADGESRTPEQAMLENLANYVNRQVRAIDPMDRDEAMYRNTLWHIERMPAGSKVIVWTATVHASRTQGRLRQQPLGARLAERWGEDMASVGITAYTGMSSMAGRPPSELPEAPSGSLEARATVGSEPWAFLDGSALRGMDNVPSRLLGRFAEADWSEYFDGVVVIREEVAPVFEQWE